MSEIDKLIRKYIKIWVLCLFIFLIINGIFGYGDLIKIYKEEYISWYPLSQLISRTLVFILISGAALFAGLVFIFKVTDLLGKLRVKQYVLLFVLSIILIILWMGYVVCRSRYHVLTYIMPLFYVVISFLFGMEACLRLVESENKEV